MLRCKTGDNVVVQDRFLLARYQEHDINGDDPMNKRLAFVMLAMAGGLVCAQGNPQSSWGKSNVVGTAVFWALLIPGLIGYFRMRSLEKKTASDSDLVTSNQLIGVHGWLKFFVISLGILGPVMSLGKTSLSFLNDEVAYAVLNSFPEWVVYKNAVWFTLLAFSAFSIYAALQLRFVWKPVSVTLAKIAVASWLVSTLLINFVLPMVTFPDLTLVPDQKFLGSVFWLIVSALAWFVYLSRSKRVRATYMGRLVGTPPPEDKTPHSVSLKPAPATDLLAAEADADSASAYLQIAEELETKTMDKGLWLKAMVQSGGFDEKQQAIVYTNLRLQQLREKLLVLQTGHGPAPESTNSNGMEGPHQVTSASFDGKSDATTQRHTQTLQSSTNLWVIPAVTALVTIVAIVLFIWQPTKNELPADVDKTASTAVDPSPVSVTVPTTVQEERTATAALTGENISDSSKYREDAGLPKRTPLAGITNLEPPVPEFSDTNARIAYLNWKVRMSEKLKTKQPDFATRMEFLQTVFYESRRAGLEPSVVLGLISTLSDFDNTRVLKNEASGYMTVNPRWVSILGNGDSLTLFNTQTNLRYGCVVFRHFLDSENGDLQDAIADYVADSNGIDRKASIVTMLTTQVLEAYRYWK